ncbi:type III secretion system cytoplasmic ring protein SctQ [Tabrizicola aquatica]|uniref:type III secretion system cytoplasmic ring protein SctQ n=1 Tax=Tabrizicola aquatica TaxID=909926 RepID=UPI000CD0F5DA|nr:type III secretion system cytoplasmic ring protein SctQ [Tabrizicola aquatica]
MQALEASEPLQIFCGKARVKRIAGALPVVTQETARIAPRWFGAFASRQMETRFGPCRLQPGKVQARAMGTHLSARGKVGKTNFRVSLPKHVVPHLLAEAGIVIDESGIDPFVHALVLEHVFGPMIAVFESATGLPVSLNRVSDIVAEEVAGLPIQLRYGRGEELTAFVDMPVTDLERLLPHPGNAAAEVIAATTPVPVFLSAGAMWITAAQLAEWRAGDVIVLSAGKAPLDALLCIVGGAVAQVRPDRNAFVLLTAFRRPLSPNQERIQSMAQTELAPPADKALHPAGMGSLDDVALMVSFDLGHRTMTLAELGQLNVGSVFEIGLLADDQARIRVNGTVIGSARLVQIKDRLGVQIVSMQSIDA